MLYFIHISLQNEDLGSRYFQGLLFFISILCHFTKTLSILRLRLATDLSFCSFCYPTIADIVRNYSCQDRQKEGCYHRNHISSPPSSPKGRQQRQYIRIVLIRQDLR